MKLKANFTCTWKIKTIRILGLFWADVDLQPGWQDERKSLKKQLFKVSYVTPIITIKGEFDWILGQLILNLDW